jgi:hypothetical protein
LYKAAESLMNAISNARGSSLLADMRIHDCGLLEVSDGVLCEVSGLTSHDSS